MSPLGDFGLARFIDHDVVCLGTPSYVDPYMHTSHDSSEYEIYCFSVVLLEVACAMKLMRTLDKKKGIFRLAESGIGQSGCRRTHPRRRPLRPPTKR
jgi:hypothetical protein